MQDQNISDIYFMKLAIEQARKAEQLQEIPIGAILLLDGIIYSAHFNKRETEKDPLAHAEILAIRHASGMLEKWRLENATLYVTAEPCLLCSGAIYLSRIKRVVFGCSNPKGGALRFVQDNKKELGLNHQIELCGGVLELECAQLLRFFFRECRSRKRELDQKINTVT